MVITYEWFLNIIKKNLLQIAFTGVRTSLLSGRGLSRRQVGRIEDGVGILLHQPRDGGNRECDEFHPRLVKVRISYLQLLYVFIIQTE